jgi:hypothetical protein
MLKIVLLAYSRGVVSSRAIERLCRENVLFMAISGDSAPQFTTIAKFVRELGDDAAVLFTQVLLTCDRLGLIGRQMFAIDGVKLPSNADKRRSGTHAELAHEAERMERAVAKMLKAHRGCDEAKERGDDRIRERAYMHRLQSEAKRIREFLATHTERRSEKGALRKSNLTDNESAKMATSKGVIQGYTAVAAVDAKAQVIVAAQAHDSGSEQSVLLPMVERTDSLRTDHTLVTADAGFHSEANLRQLYERAVPALIADALMRRRDERFADRGKYQALPDPLWDKSSRAASARQFNPRTSLRPGNQHLPLSGRQKLLHRQPLHNERPPPPQVSGCQARLRALPARDRCLRHPQRTPTRQVAFFAKDQASPLEFTARMKAAIDSTRGRQLYAQRIATVEPVFANLRHNKRLDRFTLRSRPKVNAQWHLYCLVHNIEKLAHHGYGR